MEDNEKERKKAMDEVRHRANPSGIPLNRPSSFQDVINAVAIFHVEFDLSIGDKPNLADSKLKDLRVKLIQEELDEYAEALGNDDLIEVCDALGDILYVLIGAAVTHGVDLEGIFWEVHKSNMTKVGGHKGESGKWIKPDTYTPPDLERFTHAN